METADDSLTQTFERALWGRVDAFLAETAMPPGVFGKRAVNDSNLLGQMRGKRSLTLRTARKIEAFMREERARRASEAVRSGTGAAEAA